MTWWALYSNPSVGQRSWIVLVYELTLSHWCMHVAISPVDCWF